MNRGEELGDGPAPLADFGHGSLFEGAPGPGRFVATAELSRRSHFMPIEIRMETIMVSMRISIGAKWFSAERPRACTNLRRESRQKRAPLDLQFGVSCPPPSCKSILQLFYKALPYSEHTNDFQAKTEVGYAAAGGTLYDAKC